MTRRRHAGGALGLLALATLSACGGIVLFPSSSGSTHVESVPSGAEVFVMGQRVGVTPLELEDARAFPMRYPPEQRALYGRVVLRKEGCREYVVPLSVEASNHGIVAQLDCGGSSAAAGGPPVAAPAESSAPLDERLRSIDTLAEQGLISTEERRRTRARVLEEVLAPLAPPERLQRLEALHGQGLLSDEEYATLRRHVLDSL